MNNIIEKICEINSISGHEQKFINAIVDLLPSRCSVEFDNLENLIVQNNKNAKINNKVLIISPIDEVGLIINKIENDGSLKFLTIGNIKPVTLVGSVIKINNILGVIGQKPPHLQKNEKEKSVSIENMFIDIGCDDKKSALEKVQLGDVATFNNNFSQFGNGKISSKSVNSKIGCCILLKLLQNFTDCNFFCAFLTKSQVCNFGAATIASCVNPDFVIVIDSFEENVNSTNLTKARENFKLTLSPSTDKTFFKTAVDVAKLNKFNFNIEPHNKAADLEKAVSQTKHGFKTLTISVPCKLINSNCSNFVLNDAAITLNFLEKLSLNLCLN